MRKAEHYALVLDPRDHRRVLVRIHRFRDGETFVVDGQPFVVRPKHSWRLVGWRPGRNVKFFEDILQKDGVKRPLSIYIMPETPSETPVEPLDRFDTVPGPQSRLDEITPLLWRTWMRSPLYRLRMRKLRIAGSGTRIVIYLLVAVMIILVIMLWRSYYAS